MASNSTRSKALPHVTVPARNFVDELQKALDGIAFVLGGDQRQFDQYLDQIRWFISRETPTQNRLLILEDKTSLSLRIKGLDPLPDELHGEEGPGQDPREKIRDSLPRIEGIPSDSDVYWWMSEACIDLVMAKIAAENKAGNEAWYFFATARGCLGRAEMLFEMEEKQTTKRDRATKGGYAKQQSKDEFIRTVCLKHLEAKRPENGWESAEAAARAVRLGITKDVERRYPDTPVHDMLMEWLSGNADLQEIALTSGNQELVRRVRGK